MARWLSWLERRPVTAEVVGSIPIRVAFSECCNYGGLCSIWCMLTVCRRGGIGRRPGLKIPWVVIPVPVRPRSPALCRSSDTSIFCCLLFVYFIKYGGKGSDSLIINYLIIGGDKMSENEVKITKKFFISEAKMETLVAIFLGITALFYSLGNLDRITSRR